MSGLIALGPWFDAGVLVGVEEGVWVSISVDSQNWSRAVKLEWYVSLV
jgi:hypothetical protein